MRDISRYEDEYIKPDFEEYLVKQRRKKVLESIFGKHKILEIGCGMDPLFKYVNWDIQEYVVFEPGNRFFGNAVNIASGYAINIELLNEPFIYSENIRDKEFDAIVCSGLLHEVQNAENILRDIRNTCSQNTLVHINVPNANSFHRLLALEMNLISDTKQFSKRNIALQQNRVFDIESLGEICKKSGFEIIESGSYFVKPFTHDQMKKMMDGGVIDENVLDGLYSMTKHMTNLGAEIYVNCKRK